MKLSLLALPLLVLPLALQETSQSKDPQAKAPEVGKPAPAFRLNNNEGVGVRVGGKGEWRLIAFFPKAATPG